MQTPVAHALPCAGSQSLPSVQGLPLGMPVDVSEMFLELAAEIFELGDGAFDGDDRIIEARGLRTCKKTFELAMEIYYEACHGNDD